MTNLDSIFKSRDITLPTKVRLGKAMVFQWSCMDVRAGLWRRLSAKELMLLNCGVGEDSWGESSCKETQPVHSKGDQSWVFIGRTDVEAKTAIVWPPEEKRWLIWKDPDAGKDWRQEEKGTTVHEMVVKDCCWTKRHQDSWPLEEKNSIRCQKRGLITQSFCVIVLLKYKGDRESFWHRHQKGAERVPSC